MKPKITTNKNANFATKLLDSKKLPFDVDLFVESVDRNFGETMKDKPIYLMGII